MALGWSSDISASNGFFLGTNPPVLILCRFIHGGMVTRAIWGSINAASATMRVWESFL